MATSDNTDEKLTTQDDFSELSHQPPLQVGV